MKLDAHLEIINNFATSKGYKSKNGSHFSQLSFAKDQNTGKYFLIVNSTKNPIAEKFKVSYFANIAILPLFPHCICYNLEF